MADRAVARSIDAAESGRDHLKRIIGLDAHQRGDPPSAARGCDGAPQPVANPPMCRRAGRPRYGAGVVPAIAAFNCHA
jgi:hypothetical protein